MMAVGGWSRLIVSVSILFSFWKVWGCLLLVFLGVSCPKLESPLNGRLQPASCSVGKTFAGEFCTVSCRRGFRPVLGEFRGRVLSCLPSLEWSPALGAEDLKNACVRGSFYVIRL